MAREISGSIQLRKEIYSDALQYYRVHPDEFCEDVLGIKLNLYQCVMMRAAFKYSYTSFIMCRGLGKTWLSVLILVVYCLLNPNTLAGIIAPSFRQAKQALQEKYKDSLCQLSPFLEQEEEQFVCSVQQAFVKFYNGSKITAYPLGSDGAKIRGARLHIVLVDEAAYVPRFIYEKVIKPMLIVKQGYVVGQKNDEAQGNKIILASTASYRVNWLYGV
ncbi:MAG: terminase family protein, partial [Cellulosilyticum sp.]|nr:terminase family protein [Cellulosilyticum sp.]